MAESLAKGNGYRLIALHYEKQILPDYIEPEVFLMEMEDSLSTTIFLGGNGDFAILGLAGRELPFEEVAAQPLDLEKSVPPDGADFVSGIGYMGLLSYDHFDKNATDPRLPCRVFDITESLVWNRTTRQLARHRSLLRQAPSWERTPDKENSGTHDLIRTQPDWKARQEPVTYQQLVEAAIRDIRDGKYYQINLLKYFVAPDAAFRGLTSRIPKWGGSMSSAWRLPGLEMVSLSPERFVRVTPSKRGQIVETRPIKGTIERGHTPASDRDNADRLMTSAKERAELAMIIDLMRNDLNRVCVSGSVEVASPGHLESLPYAHHRVGVVRGILSSQTLGEFFEKLMPGGSITGAPKRAAMTAIRSYEGQNRGYFMGAAFFWDPIIGYLDSSLLIRTAFQLPGTMGEEDAFRFAAGSGIVLDSDPAAEEREVMLKAKSMIGS